MSEEMRTTVTGPGATCEPVLDVADLRVHFARTRFGRRQPPIRAVDGVDLELHRGETLGLVGESGCGKSTLARAVVRLVAPTSGTIRVAGVDVETARGPALRELQRHVQMVFQDPYSSLNPRRSVLQTLAEPLHAAGVRGADRVRARAQELLELVGLPADALDRYPRQFSGGQRQRIGIARALAMDPDVLVCDEAVSALDVSVRAQVINLLADLGSGRGLTMLFIAHDLSVVRTISDRVAVMYLGRVVEVATVARLYAQPAHPYTAALLSAAPIPDPVVERGRERIVLRGDVPSPSAPPSGCRFHPRCWLRTRLGDPERCRTEDPTLRVLDDGQRVACHYAEDAIATATVR